MNPPDRKYSKEHEWVKAADKVAMIGITDFAQDQLGDVVYLELPNVGTEVNQFAKVGEIESVKTVSDLFSPISGHVVEVNQAVINNPESVNEDPFGTGWLLKVEMTDPSELSGLLDADSYGIFLKQETG